MERSREKPARRSTNRAFRESKGASSRNSPAVGGMDERPKKKKSRPPKNAQVAHSASQSVIEDFDGSVNGKRKRTGKPVSVTPSVVHEDMDDDTRECEFI